MTKIEVRIDEEFSTKKGYNLKKASLRIGTSDFRPLKPAVNPTKIRKPTRLQFIKEGLLENNVKLTLDELDKIDSDPNQQRDFITRTMRVDADSIFVLNIITLMLRKDQKMTDDKIKYLANIFTLYSYQTISIIPFVYYYETRNYSRRYEDNIIQYQRKEIIEPLGYVDYLSFVKSFLKEIREHNYTDEVGLSVPNTLPLEKAEEYTNLYKDIATPVAVSDAHGQAQIGVMPQLRFIESSKGAYSLMEKNGEKYFLYGFDAKKSKRSRSSSEVVGALNFAQILYRFSSFGPTYTYPKLNIEKKVENPVIFEPRIYVFDELGYAKKNYKETLKEMETWIIEKYGKEQEGKSYRNFVKDYEAVGMPLSFDYLFDLYSGKGGEDRVDKFIESSALGNQLNNRNSRQ